MAKNYKKKNGNESRQALQKDMLNKIRSAIDKELVPWERSWLKTGLPANLVSKKTYRGINILMTIISAMEQAFSSPYWMTFLQAKTLGGHIRKDQKGTRIKYFNMKKFEHEVTGEDVYIPYSKWRVVYNLDQTEGIDSPEYGREVLKVSAIDEMITKLNIIVIKGTPSFEPKTNVIRMPEKALFDGTDNYYHTKLHELSHWAAFQLEQYTLENFKEKEVYALDELVAEIAGNLLSVEFGLNSNLENSASYIKGWSKKFEDPAKQLLKALSMAQKVVDYVLERTKTEKIVSGEEYPITINLVESVLA